jgi:hypothetical protein
MAKRELAAQVQGCLLSLQPHPPILHCSAGCMGDRGGCAPAPPLLPLLLDIERREVATLLAAVLRQHCLAVRRRRRRRR